MKPMTPPTDRTPRPLQVPIRVTGKELQLERVRLDVRTKDLAAAMGTRSSHVSQIESSRYVTDNMAKRYRDALATFATVATSPEAA